MLSGKLLNLPALSHFILRLVYFLFLFFFALSMLHHGAEMIFFLLLLHPSFFYIALSGLSMVNKHTKQRDSLRERQTIHPSSIHLYSGAVLCFVCFHYPPRVSAQLLKNLTWSKLPLQLQLVSHPLDPVGRSYESVFSSLFRVDIESVSTNCAQKTKEKSEVTIQEFPVTTQSWAIVSHLSFYPNNHVRSFPFFSFFSYASIIRIYFDFLQCHIFPLLTIV
jgi:hypothetical protein